MWTRVIVCLYICIEWHHGYLKSTILQVMERLLCLGLIYVTWKMQLYSVRKKLLVCCAKPLRCSCEDVRQLCAWYPVYRTNRIEILTELRWSYASNVWVVSEESDTSRNLLSMASLILPWEMSGLTLLYECIYTKYTKYTSLGVWHLPAAGEWQYSYQNFPWWKVGRIMSNCCFNLMLL